MSLGGRRHSIKGAPSCYSEDPSAGWFTLSCCSAQIHPAPPPSDNLLNVKKTWPWEVKKNKKKKSSSGPDQRGSKELFLTQFVFSSYLFSCSQKWINELKLESSVIGSSFLTLAPQEDKVDPGERFTITQPTSRSGSGSSNAHCGPLESMAQNTPASLPVSHFTCSVLLHHPTDALFF